MTAILGFPMIETPYSLRLARWDEDSSLLKSVRQQVFMEEQGVPADLEWDGEDQQALHLLALDDHANPIGCARLLPSGQIGRVAVLKPWRGRGIGRSLLQRLLKEADSADYPPLFLHAQLSALHFYTGQGFKPEGSIFHEAGIPHQQMTRSHENE
jgi:predicted GNAT family N-acyltransferase